ncbi:MAG TPA: aromatic ring-opening dioxygenase LigA [Actinoplanes sp.]|nr:aromatic ring-opening dioxygenase LigA [Actinoplanes sp.]
MATTATAAPQTTSAGERVSRMSRTLALIIVVAGALMFIAGAATWTMVRNQLADEKITVADDARWFAGDRVDGPLTAYSQADIINHHALDASSGKTYAELDREDPVRATMMNASFLRASLFTSVLAFGVSAMAMGIGLLLGLIGMALMSAAKAAALPGPSAS